MWGSTPRHCARRDLVGACETGTLPEPAGPPVGWPREWDRRRTSVRTPPTPAEPRVRLACARRRPREVGSDEWVSIADLDDDRHRRCGRPGGLRLHPLGEAARDRGGRAPLPGDLISLVG